MDPRLSPKSDLYVFGGYVLLAIALVVNPLALWFWAAQGIIPQVPAHHFHESDIRYLLPGMVTLLSAVMGGIMIWAPKRLRYYLNDSFAFNLFLFCALVAIMFSLNVIQPGQFKVFRLLYLVGLLFFLLNTLYQAVVKKRDGAELHPFYRNLAVAIFGITFLLIILEGVFMFHQGTHRFNGTLGSRAWFLNHWELNAEGYRDAGYDSTRTAKRKILVIGDSFVAGHGVADRKDRFTDQLEAMIPENEYSVYNLGVGGSDTRDENKRLREFPFKPDILIFSWYPNDIEQDGELGGLTLQHARSYHDLPGIARYFARRSYLWNYIYWRYPHPDELSDYFGYIKQCFAFLKVRYAHLQEIDRLVAYGDSLHVPMAAVVFPFLENAEGSQFATDPIEERFSAHGVPTLSVRDMLLGKPAIDYIVNQNDPHPNEKLHKMVADSLLKMLQQVDAFGQGMPLPTKEFLPEPKPEPALIPEPKPEKKVEKPVNLQPQAPHEKETSALPPEPKPKVEQHKDPDYHQPSKQASTPKPKEKPTTKPKAKPSAKPEEKKPDPKPIDAGPVIINQDWQGAHPLKDE